MGARALAMKLNTDDYPESAAELVEELIILKRGNESANPVDGQLRSWINDRLTALAALPHLSADRRETILKETKVNIQHFRQNFEVVLKSRPEPIYA